MGTTIVRLDVRFDRACGDSWPATLRSPSAPLEAMLLSRRVVSTGISGATASPDRKIQSVHITTSNEVVVIVAERSKARKLMELSLIVVRIALRRRSMIVLRLFRTLSATLDAAARSCELNCCICQQVCPSNSRKDASSWRASKV